MSLASFHPVTHSRTMKYLGLPAAQNPFLNFTIIDMGASLDPLDLHGIWSLSGYPHGVLDCGSRPR